LNDTIQGWFSFGSGCSFFSIGSLTLMRFSFGLDSGFLSDLDFRLYLFFGLDFVFLSDWILFFFRIWILFFFRIWIQLVFSQDRISVFIWIRILWFSSDSDSLAFFRTRIRLFSGSDSVFIWIRILWFSFGSGFRVFSGYLFKTL
jgi:hypothetical protein